jgi:putative flavoprotein involved in K+ transport
LRGLIHRVMTLSTPIGRKARRRHLSHAMPLLRVKPRHLAAAGVLRVPPTVAVRDGRPVLEDGRELEVANVIWCTGFDAGFSWIDLPVHGPQEPHARAGDREKRTGPVLRRPPLPVRGFIGADPRGPA